MYPRHCYLNLRGASFYREQRLGRADKNVWVDKSSVPSQGLDAGQYMRQIKN